VGRQQHGRGREKEKCICMYVVCHVHPHMYVYNIYNIICTMYNVHVQYVLVYHVYAYVCVVDASKCLIAHSSACTTYMLMYVCALVLYIHTCVATCTL
jgi:hypothetical protein